MKVLIPMNEETEKISRLVERSGNAFHFKVANFFKQQRWHVLISPYYNDRNDDKIKEIDIVATRFYLLADSWGEPLRERICVRFFIECKYINGPIAFWFGEKDKIKAEKLIVLNTPLKSSEANQQIVGHHYYSEDRVVKLFSTNINGEDIIFKAVSQSLNSMLYYKQNGIQESTTDERKVWGNTLFIDYPLIVCNNFNRFYEVDTEEEGRYSKISGKNIQLELNYAYHDVSGRAKNEYFLVDVVNFQEIEAFLSLLEREDIKVISEVREWEIQHRRS